MGWTPPHLNGIYVPNWKFHQPVKRKEKSTMKIIRVGVDLAKNVFQVHGVDRNEKPVWKRKLSREEWLKVLLKKIEPGCGSAWKPAVEHTTGLVSWRCTDIPSN
jgi:hypothetical protein